MHNYEQRFLTLYQNWKRLPMFQAMAVTVENSPWHREKNVLLHTEMVINEYMSVIENDEWTHLDFMGAIAIAFHDVGKPPARTERFTEARGTHFAFSGHEIISARMFEDFINANPIPGINQYNAFYIAWMIEHHMPWALKDETKRAWMALTARAIGAKTYVDALVADQRGRLSDDTEQKLRDVDAWVHEFLALVNSVSVAPLVVKPTLYVAIAPSGAGKSTMLAKLQSNGLPLQVFSLDALRHEWYDATDYAKAWQMSTEDKGFASKANARFVEQIKTKVPLFVDNTNLSAKRRRFYLDMARQHGYRTEALLFPTTIDTLLARQQSRSDKTVPEEAVRRQYMSLQLPMFGEFDHIMVTPS